MNLNEFLTEYGESLAQVAQETLNPLHVPSKHPPVVAELLRKPFEAQAHVITAQVKQLNRANGVITSAEMGTGKTFMGCGTVHTHARQASSGRWAKKRTKEGESYVLRGKASYRALVMCPPQLVKKWKREVETTIPNAKCRILNSLEDMMDLAEEGKPNGAEWYIISREKAKLSCGWRGCAVTKAGSKALHCPRCMQPILDKDGNPRKREWIDTTRRNCTGRRKVYRFVDGQHMEYFYEDCGERLWEEIPKPRRYAPAAFAKKKMRRFFDYLIADEAHELKSPDSIQAQALGWLACASKRVIGLTGTIVGGYAWHVRTLLFRAGLGKSMVDMGYGWSNEKAFNVTYGRIETKIVSSDGDDARSIGHRYSRGSSKGSKTEYVRPGIVPTLFSQHLAGNAVFLGLDEISENLPMYKEDVIGVPMGEALSLAYTKLEKSLRETVSKMMQLSHGKDKRLLATMLQTLLCYPDHPFGWEPIGYYDKANWVRVATPEELDEADVYPKEKALIEIVEKEKRAGRRVWVYTVFTGERDCAGRLEKILTQHGHVARTLRATVDPLKREEWIAKYAPVTDVIISHPELVKTGLDFFGEGYNVPTIVFFSTGYNAFTLMQAARRAWRIGQRRECRTMYLYYEGTMSAGAMNLMGQKMTAANAVCGRFSAEGITALAGEGESVEMALARDLANNVKVEDAARAWSKLTTSLSARTVSVNADAVGDIRSRLAALRNKGVVA